MLNLKEQSFLVGMSSKSKVKIKTRDDGIDI